MAPMSQIIFTNYLYIQKAIFVYQVWIYSNEFFFYFLCFVYKWNCSFAIQPCIDWNHIIGISRTLFVYDFFFLITVFFLYTISTRGGTHCTIYIPYLQNQFTIFFYETISCILSWKVCFMLPVFIYQLHFFFSRI